MNRRMLLSVILSVIVITFYPVVLQKFFPHLVPKKGVVTSHQKSPLSREVVQSSEIISPEPEGKIETSPKEEIQAVLSNDKLEVTFSNVGASVKRLVLLGYKDAEGKPLSITSDLPFSYRPLALNRVGAISNVSSLPFKIEKRQDSVFCEVTLSSGIILHKTFSLDGYVINCEMEFLNPTGEGIGITDGYAVVSGTMFPMKIQDGGRYMGIDVCPDYGKVVRITPGSVKGFLSHHGSFRWAAVRNKYYGFILQGERCASGSFCNLLDKGKREKGYLCGLLFGEFSVKAGGSVVEKAHLYAGPKSYESLKAFGQGYEQIMNFGTFAPLSLLILKLLAFFYRVFKNYGVAIILLTIVVKIILHPLTQKSFKSMSQMQKIQPLIQQLKEKYKDDPKKQQQEMMALYKEHKINPFGGCLPMVLQFPFFIALFTTLQSSVELQGARFLWMKDLSYPDTVAVIAGIPLNILPIIMGITMLIQQKISTVDKSQAAMVLFMPIFFTFIFYNFPSGLVLYWLTNNILTIAHQYLVQKKS